MCFFKHGNLAACRIFGSVHPCVVVIPTYHPLVRALAATQPRDDVVSGCELEIEFKLEMDGRPARPDVVRNRQRASP